MASAHLIQLTKLTKRYGSAPAPALNAVSLNVAAGEVYGFLGANGAGKSTTIRLLLNFIEPTSGTGQILGKDIVTDSVAIKQHVGYLAGDVALYGSLTGKQQLDYLASLSGDVNRAYLQSLCDRFEAELSKPVNTLSKGNRQKIGIIQAFMHQPTVLILDEPTSGLDPLMQEVFFKLIAECKERGAAVFMSSHNFAEVQRTCDRIGIIRKGSLVAERRISEVGHATQRFTIRFSGAVPLAKLQALSTVTIASHDKHSVELAVQGSLSPLLHVLATSDVTHLTSQGADLEQEFLQFYEEDAA